VPVVLTALVAVVFAVLGITIDRGLLVAAAFGLAICVIAIFGAGIENALTMMSARQRLRRLLPVRYARRRLARREQGSPELQRALEEQLALAREQGEQGHGS
jgi:hypothetical protein